MIVLVTFLIAEMILTLTTERGKASLGSRFSPQSAGSKAGWPGTGQLLRAEEGRGRSLQVTPAGHASSDPVSPNI